MIFRKILRSNQFIGASISVLAMTAAAVLSTATAHAAELWDTRLRGVDEGAASGALPPAGVFGVVYFFFVGL